MSVPMSLANFPSGPGFTSQTVDFNKVTDLGNFDWYGSGHVAPDGLYDIDGGAVQLGSGSAASGDYIQGQWYGSTIRLNRLLKTFKFEWKIQLSSATLTQFMVGVCATNTNLLGTNPSTGIVDGFGFFGNIIASGAPASGYVYAFNDANNAYSQYQGNALDTNLHTASIMLITDNSTTGAGAMSFYWDGVPMGAGFSSSSSAIFSTQLLRLSVAMGNGSAVAQTMNLDFMAWSDQV